MVSLSRFISGVFKSSIGLILLTTQLAPLQAAPAKKGTPVTGYEKAAKELPQDLYVLYRIVDRISRANSLDERPWRVLVVPKYDINAFATDVNLVAMYSGILDQLAGDTSAIACVVGHEMAHSVKRHIALGAAQQQALIQQITKEAEAEVGQEVSNAQSSATATSVAGGILGGLLGGTIGGLGSSILQGASNRRIETARQRVQEIVRQKQEELSHRVAETSRNQEFEADEIGYTYMARAGFDPEGCLRSMEVVSRTPGAEFDTTHPAVPKRIEALKQLFSRSPATTLAAQGKVKITATKPLTYDLSNDGISLRVNSRFAGSSTSDLERMFGK